MSLEKFVYDDEDYYYNNETGTYLNSSFCIVPSALASKLASKYGKTNLDNKGKKEYPKDVIRGILKKYNLNSNFVYTKPYSFCLDGYKEGFCPTQNWCDCFADILVYLYAIYGEPFKYFMQNEADKYLSGQNVTISIHKCNLTSSVSESRAQYIPQLGIYFNNCFSANSFVRLLKDIFKGFGIPDSKFFISVFPPQSK